eukprot:m.596601 g.596601  ORF g.596601 m.596601 type:complete len:594 (+) comp22413_c0_seq2:194-1975(+)
MADLALHSVLKSTLVTVLLSCAASTSDGGSTPSRNVVLIMLDDMRPETPGFNRSWVPAPVLDSIAARGTRFARAYVQAPQCCPTRNSLLTGLRPDRTRVFTNGDLSSPDLVPAAPKNATGLYFRTAMPNGTATYTLASYFKSHGYFTWGAGKTFHPGTGLSDADAGEASYSFSEKYYFCLMDWSARWMAPTNATMRKFNMSQGCKMSPECEACLIKAGTMTPSPSQRFGNSTAYADCPDACYVDNNVAAFVAKRIRTRASQKKKAQPDVESSSSSDAIGVSPSAPWLLMLGMRNPHLPWFTPFSDMEAVRARIPPSEQISPHTSPPQDALLSGDPYDNFEFWLMQDLLPIRTNTSGFPEVPTSYHSHLRLGYWSAIAYTDRQIGLVVDALIDTGEYDQTVFAVVGDHGYGLGELGSWGKYTLLEQGTRAYMTIAVPGQNNPGSVCTDLVEFVDLFPTLAEAAGLPPPPNVDGVSLLPLIMAEDNSPLSSGQTYSKKDRVFSQYPAVHRVVNSSAIVMGAAMRTHLYRLVAWCFYDFGAFTPNFDNCTGFEVYGYKGIDANDVNNFDLTNLASTNATLVATLLSEMKTYWPQHH